MCKLTEVTTPCLTVHSTCDITVPRLVATFQNIAIFLASFPGLCTAFVACSTKSMELYWRPPYSPTVRPVSSEVRHLSMQLHQIFVSVTST